MAAYIGVASPHFVFPGVAQDDILKSLLQITTFVWLLFCMFPQVMLKIAVLQESLITMNL